MTHFTLAQLKRIRSDYMVKYALAVVASQKEASAMKREALQKDADECREITWTANAEIVERDTEGK